MKENNVWKVINEDYIPNHEPFLEALFVLGNDCVATCAAVGECVVEEGQYPEI